MNIFPRQECKYIDAFIFLKVQSKSTVQRNEQKDIFLKWAKQWRFSLQYQTLQVVFHMKETFFALYEVSLW